MSYLLVVAALAATAAPPPASRARELAKAGSWEELYLAFSSAKPDAYRAAERAGIAAELARGCEALEKGDGVMAYSLGDRAAAFQPSAPALLCLARTALATEQRAAAEAALRRGLKKYPRTGAFGLMLGNLLLDEKDPRGASEALAKVPRSAPEYARAQALLGTAKETARQEREAKRQAHEVEQRMGKAPGDAEAPGPVPEAKSAKDGVELTSGSGEGPGGMRYRSQGNFILKYFNNQRDFGQRADFETKVMGVMDEARETARRVLGRARETPLDVVLYTKEEFAAHFSTQTARRVAGFYGMESIRINGAAELDRENRAVLVHEYTHSVVDELCAGQGTRMPLWLNEGLSEYVEWRYLGVDRPRAGVSVRLRELARANKLPRLRDMDRAAPINETDPEAAYATSGVAVRILTSNGGTEGVLALMEEVCKGAAFEEALQSRYGRSLDQLQSDLRGELSRR